MEKKTITPQMPTKARPIKIFSMETDEFFKIFLQDALVIYSSREVLLTFSASVQEALDSLSKGLPDVPDIIFLGLAIPSEAGGKKIDLLAGFKVLKILRQNESFKKVPIVIFSKYGEKVLQKRAQALGATKYLVKGECMPKDIAAVVACADKIYTESIKAVSHGIFPWRRQG